MQYLLRNTVRDQQGSKLAELFLTALLWSSTDELPVALRSSLNVLAMWHLRHTDGNLIELAEPNVHKAHLRMMSFWRTRSTTVSAIGAFLRRSDLVKTKFNVSKS